MANKRIELEQCKYFVDLQEEYPNSKSVRTGVLVSMVAVILLLVAFMVYGLMSNGPAQNPGNVLETPQPAIQEGTDIPSSDDFQIPEMDTGTTPMPDFDQGTIPFEIPESRTDTDAAVSRAPIPHGELLAQAQPASSDPAGTFTVPEGSFPAEELQEDTGIPAEETVDEAESTGPDRQTEGVGNLANLANWIDGRGFQIYVLLISIVLMVLMYLVIRGTRKGGGGK